MRIQLVPLVTSLILALGLSPAAAATLAHTGQPRTPRRAVTNEFHGVKVTEDYRWLENWNDPKVQQWSAAQNTYTRGVLDKLPHRDDIRRRVEELDKSPSPNYYGLKKAGGWLLAMKAQPPKQQPFLVALTSPDSPTGERVILDPNRLNPKGTTAIDYFQPTHDGKLLAVSLSESGSEDGDLHLYEIATGKALKDVIPHFAYHTAGG